MRTKFHVNTSREDNAPQNLSNIRKLWPLVNPGSSDPDRELKQRRRRRRGRRLVKNECIFYLRNSRLSRSVRCFNGSKSLLKLNMHRRRSIPNGNTKNKPSSSTFRRRRTTWSFHVVVLQRTAKKCTKIYD